jgi:hypothetical protein
MSLHRKNELVDRLSRLVTEVETLKTVAVLGFQERDTQMVEANVSALKEFSKGRFVDLRPRHVQAADWPSWLGERSIALLVDKTAVPPELETWVKAVVEQHGLVAVGAGAPVARNASQSVYVLCQGCTDVDSLPDALICADVVDYLP